ncbi:hypothetical protein Adt_14116 [Abeliophyllum distichum]|uniref:Uncharacterized protein n=1 Tax=Abeliophyllum distichum TaxID=126358 RepID=A0ABD1TYQ8_9LAMI
MGGDWAKYCKTQGGRVPVGEALARSVAPWEEQAAMWPSPNGRSSCVKRCSIGRSKLQGWPSPSGRGYCARRCSMGGASCKVVESQWERLLHEALLHGRSKLQGGRVPVGEAIARSIAPCEEEAARWPSPSRRDSCAKRCSMGGDKLQSGRVPVGEALA